MASTHWRSQIRILVFIQLFPTTQVSILFCIILKISTKTKTNQTKEQQQQQKKTNTVSYPFSDMHSTEGCFSTRSCFCSLICTQHLQQEPNIKLVFSQHYLMRCFQRLHANSQCCLLHYLHFIFYWDWTWRAAVCLDDHGCCNRKPKLFPKVEFIRISVFSSAYNTKKSEHVASLAILPGLGRHEKQSEYGEEKLLTSKSI